MTQQEDPWGFVTTMQYDALDHAVLVTDPDGPTELAYTPAGKETFRRTAEGQITTQLYDALGRLVEETDPRGRKLYHAYDLDDNEIFTLRTWPGHGGGPAQVRTRRQYDPLNRVEFELQADGAQGTTPLPILYTYDKVGNLLIEERPDGRTTTTTYDELNRPVVVTDALTQSTVVRYDGVGNERFRTDRRGHTWEMQYDALNRKILDRSPPLSATGFPIETEYTYDAVGNLRFQTNPRLPGVADARTETTYDDLNRPLDTFKRAVLANPPIRLVHNEYDTSGLKTGTRQDAITDANGNRVVYDKNFRGQEIRKEYPPDANSVVVSEAKLYDKVGNLIQSTDGDGLVTQIAYFPDNTQASMTNAELETTRYEYDINGNRIRETRPKGDAYTTTYLYDERSRLVRVTNPEGGVTRYEYDPHGNLRHQYTPPANDQGIESHVEYTYDVLNRRTAHIQHKASGNLTTTLGYDPEGNLTSRLDPKGQTFTYAYDEVNRKTLETYPAAPSAYLQIQTIETEYDNNNNVTVVTETKSGALDGSGAGGTVVDVCDMTYDLFDRLLTRTQRGKLVTYTYDDNGNRTSVTSSGGTTVYTFDHRNRLETARLNVDGPTTYTYRNNSWLALVEYPNGTEVATTYDNAGRSDTVTNRQTAGALISSFTYEYDDNGNRTLQVEEQTGFADGQIQSTTYTYDRTDRLTGYDIETLDSGDVQSTRYTYYPSYDRRTEQVVLTTLSGSTSHKDRVYRYDETHWLTEIQNSSDGLKISYAYDNNGNQIEKLDSTQAMPEQTQFVYDSRNQLTQATHGSPGSETDQGRYDYDYLGMRVRHLGSERGDIEYVYDGRAILDELTGAGTGSGPQLAHYNYADRLLSLDTPAETQYYHFASLDTTANLSDEAGMIKVSYRTDPYGQITREEGSSLNRQVFTGQEHDEQTGLIYFGARYYDPDAARFINQDSYLGEQGTPPSLHRYLYAYSNPTVYVDRHGYSSEADMPALQFSDSTSSQAANPDWSVIDFDDSDWRRAVDRAKSRGRKRSQAQPTTVDEILTPESRDGAISGSESSPQQEEASANSSANGREEQAGTLAKYPSTPYRYRPNADPAELRRALEDRKEYIRAVAQKYDIDPRVIPMLIMGEFEQNLRGRRSDYLQQFGIFTGGGAGFGSMHSEFLNMAFGRTIDPSGEGLDIRMDLDRSIDAIARGLDRYASLMEKDYRGAADPRSNPELLAFLFQGGPKALEANRLRNIQTIVDYDYGVWEEDESALSFDFSYETGLIDRATGSPGHEYNLPRYVRDHAKEWDDLGNRASSPGIRPPVEFKYE